MSGHVNGRITTQHPVSVSLEELRNDRTPFSALEEAFGPYSLGILIVRDLPPGFIQLRKTLLSYSSYLANLPQEELAKLEDPDSHYLVGWSCGKETLKDGRYDTLKGSYYMNPRQTPSYKRRAQELYPDLCEYNAENVWPGHDVLPGFHQSFQSLCDLIIDVAALVARACDRYAAEKIPGYQPGYLEYVVKTSVSTKARLLHYCPSTASGIDGDTTDGDEDDWCATHLDHGCLTGLTSAMFVDEGAHPPIRNKTDEDLPALPELGTPPDPKAGLYIHSRSGQVIKVSIPKDCLAFQTGEALEVITKGEFKAVPHFVRGIAPGMGGKIARNTLAVFTQPNLWEKVDEGSDFATFAKGIVERNH
ncbi:hypothetical protein LTR50_003909 [Elasticomyces elasticus]|nr:hypothetical protein LTR50_003909 [Elasticomyces elasticus]